MLFKAVRNVAKDKGLSIEDTLKSTECRDAVYKAVFPTRAEAEGFVRDDYNANAKAVSVVGEMYKVFGEMKATEGPLAEMSEELKAVKFPSTGALDAFYKAGLEYELAECDRIYGHQ